MSTQSEIIRIKDARDTIRNKMVNLGICLATDKIDTIATKIQGIENKGAVSLEVTEGNSVTIPAGYHNGAGVVTGVGGGGNYTLQEKTVTPTKETQAISSDTGYYGLSAVTVNPIPDAYSDVSGTTATEDTVLATKIFTKSNGVTSAGTMPNVGKEEATISVATPSHTISKGYHDGTGKVTLSTEEKSATPTTSSQDITPTSGKVLSKVTVAAIPSKYKDASSVSTDATADKILSGEKVIGVDGSGNKALITGSMTNQGAKALTMDGLTTTSVTIPAGYHNGSGTVSLTNDIETNLAEI